MTPQDQRAEEMAYKAWLQDANGDMCSMEFERIYMLGFRAAEEGMKEQIDDLRRKWFACQGEAAAANDKADEWKWEYENVCKFATDFENRLTAALEENAKLKARVEQYEKEDEHEFKRMEARLALLERVASAAREFRSHFVANGLDWKSASKFLDALNELDAQKGGPND